MRLELKNKKTGEKLIFKNNKEIADYINSNFNANVKEKDVRDVIVKYFSKDYGLIFWGNTLE